MVAPESRSGDSDREVKLGVTRINSGQGTANSPLFMLAGGPGQAQINPEFFSLLQTELLGGILDARDIVVVEQRGTEHTDPFLTCPEANSAPWDVYEQGLTGDDATALRNRDRSGVHQPLRGRGHQLRQLQQCGERG